MEQYIIKGGHPLVGEVEIAERRMRRCDPCGGNHDG